MYIFRNVKINLLFGCLILTTACKDTPNESSEPESQAFEYAMVIHGGAGTLTRANMTSDKETDMYQALNDALDIGNEILMNNGTAEEAVINTIIYMENSPLFNAGKGAVFTHDGENAMDASIMRGRDLQAGAVGGVTNIKNPITAANAVMTNSKHAMMVGEGAEEFAKSQNLDIVDPSYFYTERRWNSLQKALEAEKEIGDIYSDNSDYKHGTVGAIALDMEGNIVAGTSTGGMTNKKYDRIGDSPIIGAGTYANNQTCGVSCTGHGEYFIRYAVAHDVSAMMEYKNLSVSDAANHIINEKLKSGGGSGGLIALDKNGHVAMPFNTEGMYRGFVNNVERYTAIYKDE